jgi:elongation factor 1 alpha-like protein
MSRHRDFRRGFDIDNEMSDDVYGRSVEEDYAVSPGTASQYQYKGKEEERSLFSFMSTPQSSSSKKKRQKSGEKTAGMVEGKVAPLDLSVEDENVDDEERVLLESGKEYITSVVGAEFSKEDIVEALLRCDLNAEIALSELLTQRTMRSPTTKPKKPSLISFAPVGSTSTKDEDVLTRPVNDLAMAIALERPPLKESSSLHVSPVRTPERSPSPSVQAVALPSSSQQMAKVPHLQRSISKSKANLDVMAEYKKRESTEKTQINLVVIGHVDAGKSTLMGHMLFLLGEVSKKAMHKYETESAKIGKSSFAFAWILDETGEERHRGITMDIACRRFETPHRIVNLLDAPGHKDFIPNMISGTAQADVALLVVDATVGEFEAGFEAGGQTREHAMLARSLGVKQLVVAVNKMDMVKWSKDRFKEIEQKLKPFLKQTGYKEVDVSFVPCSGLNGENLAKPPSCPVLSSWYTGPTLLEEVDRMSPPPRLVDREFRCCVSDIFKGQGVSINVAGRIEQGHVQCGETVLVAPANEPVSIKSITVNDDSVQWAAAGEHVVIAITGIDPMKLSIGSVLCSMSQPVRVCSKFRARIIVFTPPFPITPGSPIILHYQSINEPAVVTKLISVLHKSTGEVLKKKPKCLTKQVSAEVQIESSRPVCLELYQDCKDLGRFMMRIGGDTVAAGVVTKILSSM